VLTAIPFKVYFNNSTNVIQEQTVVRTVVTRGTDMSFRCFIMLPGDTKWIATLCCSIDTQLILKLQCFQDNISINRVLIVSEVRVFSADTPST
jgi:hypothetical protein